MIGADSVVGLTGNVIVVLKNAYTGKKEIHITKNVVTDAGDLYYAQRAALLTMGPLVPIPDEFTDAAGLPDMVMEIYDNTPANNAVDKANDWADLLGTLAPSSSQPMEATYPKVNDTGDPDNTGDAVDAVTYHVNYATGEANQADNTDIILTNPTPSGTEALLMHAEFGASFTKTSAQTLKVFINHTFLGA